MLVKIREIAPENFLLLPGVGAQGGSLEEVAKYGMNRNCGIIVNASRSIIFAGNDEDYSQRAREEAQKLQEQMQKLLKDFQVI